MALRARIPISFAQLEAEYPDKLNFPTPDLLGAVGGEIRSSMRDDANTCAVRLSWAFNHAGHPLQKVGGDIYWRNAEPRIDPKTEGWVRPTILHEVYMIRIGDVKRYLTARYGPGTKIFDGKEPDKFQIPITGPTQGIIVFEWHGAIRGPAGFGATGHADLFRVLLSKDRPPTLKPICTGECYWVQGPMLAFLWETNP